MKTALSLTTAMTLVMCFSTANAAIQDQAPDLHAVSSENLAQTRKVTAVMAALANGLDVGDDHLITSFNELFNQAGVEFNSTTVNDVSLMNELFVKNANFRIGLEQIAAKKISTINSAWSKYETQIAAEVGDDAQKGLSQMFGDPRVQSLYVIQRDIINTIVNSSNTSPGLGAGVSGSTTTDQVAGREPVSA